MIPVLILTLAYLITYAFLPKAFWRVYLHDSFNFKAKAIALVLFGLILAPFMKLMVLSFILGFILADPFSYYFTTYKSRS